MTLSDFQVLHFLLSNSRSRFKKAIPSFSPLLMTSNAPTASPPCSPLVICGPPPPNFIHRDHLSPNSRNRSSQPTHSSRDLPPCPTNFNQRWYFLHLLVWNSLQNKSASTSIALSYQYLHLLKPANSTSYCSCPIALPFLTLAFHRPYGML